MKAATVRAAGYEVVLRAHPSRPLMLPVRMAAPSAGVRETVWDDLARHFTVASFDLRELRSVSSVR